VVLEASGAAPIAVLLLTLVLSSGRAANRRIEVAKGVVPQRVVTLVRVEKLGITVVSTLHVRCPRGGE
jgi:hypothetical protein